MWYYTNHHMWSSGGPRNWEQGMPIVGRRAGGASVLLSAQVVEEAWAGGARGRTGGYLAASAERSGERRCAVEAAARAIETRWLPARVPVRGCPCPTPSGLAWWIWDFGGVGKWVRRLDGPWAIWKWAAFELYVNCYIKWHINTKKRNFNTLCILHMYIPRIYIKFFLKNVGYAREYPGTTVGPPMMWSHVNHRGR
jgi:hypothetical protein